MFSNEAFTLSARPCVGQTVEGQWVRLASVEKAVEYLAKHGLGPAPLQIEDADAEEG